MGSGAFGLVRPVAVSRLDRRVSLKMVGSSPLTHLPEDSDQVLPEFLVARFLCREVVHSDFLELLVVSELGRLEPDAKSSGSRRLLLFSQHFEEALSVLDSGTEEVQDEEEKGHQVEGQGVHLLHLAAEELGVVRPTPFDQQLLREVLDLPGVSPVEEDSRLLAWIAHDGTLLDASVEDAFRVKSLELVESIEEAQLGTKLVLFPHILWVL